ncbi:MAG: glycosyl hydrolase 53 family protein, partial [Bacteroidota bacterium]
VDDLPILADSLYHYIHATLLELHAEDLAPELVQIGNETNKGILQSAEDDAAGWALDWPRNATLFNRAIAAVRDVGTMTDWDFKVAVHIAGPAEAEWLLTGFTENDVTDFDIIGLSYYWAWHQPTTIEQTGEILEQLRVSYPGKEVMIFETGYIWTTDANDSANNIINAVQPGYAPASPENQRRWLIDLTREVIDRGGLGVVYWEPAWVSTPCFTPWGQGSHQEHATFFDFNNHVLANGGMAFFSYPYTGISSVASPSAKTNSLFLNYLPSSLTLQLELRGDQRVNNGQVRIFNSAGQEILHRKGIAADTNFWSILLPQWPSGAYWVELQSNRKSIGRRAFIIP